MGEVELGKRFNGDAWYAVIAAVAGLLSGTALTWWRDRDPLLTAGLVLLGAVVAAGMMATLGGWIGPADPQSVAASARSATRCRHRCGVDAFVCYLVWPVTALLGSLIVLWSPARRHGFRCAGARPALGSAVDLPACGGRGRRRSPLA